MGGDIDRFAPRLTIVLTFHEHKLGGLVRCHSRHGVPPSPFVTHTMRPRGYYPDRIGLFVYQDRWVSHAVLSVGQAIRLFESHGYSHRFPSLSLIGTAAYSDIDFLLQVHAAIIANIVDSK